MTKRGTYRLSVWARADIIDILAETEDRFGRAARERYQKLLVTALRELADDPERIGCHLRPELGDGVSSDHLRHSRKRARHETGIVKHPRHLLLYRVLNPELIGIGRILHDAMELQRHLPPDYGAD
ncbi:toxin ParE1/3/4 [Neorhizobium huautlense]|uniref:Toxin ParE1/3/4 n=1 Tax=Neorhizobium huautlense TaxID=67774 RepID=A0ABT9PY38_9HYPH|nr:type II toxin-antitoxin system RelE/ParE family toxin [Neorhizobium huautlense]MDP9839395.1 toxin ParE1/3/4 [Neorhizobium huautlense]